MSYQFKPGICPTVRNPHRMRERNEIVRKPFRLRLTGIRFATNLGFADSEEGNDDIIPIKTSKWLYGSFLQKGYNSLQQVKDLDQGLFSRICR